MSHMEMFERLEESFSRVRIYLVIVMSEVGFVALHGTDRRYFRKKGFPRSSPWAKKGGSKNKMFRISVLPTGMELR